MQRQLLFVGFSLSLVPAIWSIQTAWTGEEWSNFENEHLVVKNDHEQAIDVALGKATTPPAFASAA